MYDSRSTLVTIPVQLRTSQLGIELLETLLLILNIFKS